MESRAAVSQTLLPGQLVQTDTALQAVCRCLSGDSQAFLFRVQGSSRCSFSIVYDMQAEHSRALHLRVTVPQSKMVLNQTSINRLSGAHSVFVGLIT